jgi:hypothetical protein
MPLAYQNLDAETRAFMVEEIDTDANQPGKLYISNYLTDLGKRAWPQMLRDAALSGTDATLAVQIARPGILEEYTQRRKPKGGGMYTARIPVNAPEVMSEGEFNRFYVRGICRRAIKDGIKSLVVYRAKAVSQPRPESEAKIGMTIDPAVLLTDLREMTGLEPALGIPPGPGSGLSVRLP